MGKIRSISLKLPDLLLLIVRPTIKGGCQQGVLPQSIVRFRVDGYDINSLGMVDTSNEPLLCLMCNSQEEHHMSSNQKHRYWPNNWVVQLHFVCVWSRISHARPQSPIVVDRNVAIGQLLCRGREWDGAVRVGRYGTGGGSGGRAGGGRRMLRCAEISAGGHI